MKKTYSLYEAKAKLSEIIREVRERGVTVVVSYHGRPVAEIRPVEQEPALDPRVAELVRKGLMTAPSRKMPPDFWDMPIGEDPTGSVLEALLEERREGR